MENTNKAIKYLIVGIIFSGCIFLFVMQSMIKCDKSKDYCTLINYTYYEALFLHKEKTYEFKLSDIERIIPVSRSQEFFIHLKTSPENENIEVSDGMGLQGSPYYDFRKYLSSNQNFYAYKSRPDFAYIAFFVSIMIAILTSMGFYPLKRNRN